MTPNPREAEVTREQWRAIAASILNNRHLHAFLRANRAHLWREIYDALKPHLSFKPKPYFLLIH